MEEQRWLRLITIGLVLAAMAVGYFLISDRFVQKPKLPFQVTKPLESPKPSPSPVLGANTQAPAPSGVGQATPSAYSRIVERTRGGVQTLPRTGFPIFLIAVFSLGALIAGLGLRRFPN